MTTWTRLWAAGLLVGTTMLPRAHAQDLVTFRVDVVGGRATDDGKGGIRWLIDVPDPPSACVDIEIAVVLVSETGACVNDPSLCSGLERSLDGYRGCADGGLRCADGIDNDDDGLVDALDPECDGVATWRFSIEADESFVLDSVTTDDTAADIYPIAGPGRRDLCSLNKTDPVEASSNNGSWGAVSTVGLSLFGAVALDPVGEFVVLRLSGTLSTSAPPASGSCSPTSPDSPATETQSTRPFGASTIQQFPPRSRMQRSSSCRPLKRLCRFSAVIPMATARERSATASAS